MVALFPAWQLLTTRHHVLMNNVKHCECTLRS